MQALSHRAYITSNRSLMFQRPLCLVTQSCPTLCDPMDCSPPGSSVHGDSSGKNTGVGCHSLLQGIFRTQGLNPGLPHYRRIFYQLSQEGGPLYIVLFIISLCSKGFALLKTFCKYLEVTGYFSVHTTFLYFLECG